MLRIELDEILTEIVDGNSLLVLVFNLITWAEQTDRIESSYKVRTDTIQIIEL